MAKSNKRPTRKTRRTSAATNAEQTRQLTARFLPNLVKQAADKTAVHAQ